MLLEKIIKTLNLKYLVMEIPYRTVEQMKQSLKNYTNVTEIVRSGFKTVNTYEIITIFIISIFSWLIVTYNEAFSFLKSIYKNLQTFKKLPLKEQLKKIEAIEAQKALRKSQKKRGN